MLSGHMVIVEPGITNIKCKEFNEFYDSKMPIIIKKKQDFFIQAGIKAVAFNTDFKILRDILRRSIATLKEQSTMH